MFRLLEIVLPSLLLALPRRKDMGKGKVREVSGDSLKLLVHVPGQTQISSGLYLYIAPAISSCIFPMLSQVKDDGICVLLGWWEKTEFWEP